MSLSNLLIGKLGFLWKLKERYSPSLNQRMKNQIYFRITYIYFQLVFSYRGVHKIFVEVHYYFEYCKTVLSNVDYIFI